MKLYDAHSHLHFPENREALERFRNAENVAVCDCAVSLEDLEDLRETAGSCDGLIHPAYGIHPLYVPSNPRDFPVSKLAEFLDSAAALGEIGLDKKASTNYESQKECFGIQLKMASDFVLPAVIHCRGAWGDLLEILKRFPLERGMLIHAANCSPEIARELSRLGAVFSFGVRELGGMRGLNCAASLPVERILVESDADSDPQLLLKAVSAIADLKNDSVENMGKIIEENFLRFFNGG